MPGHAGQVGGDGREVVEVHRDRVVDLLAQLERGGRRGRRDQHVGLLEGGREVARDQRAHLLGLAVVGVVVAAGQGVGAEDDPALHLVAEPGLAGGAHDVLGRRRLDPLGEHPQAVAHGVELREVAGGLRREDQVVGRERVHEVRAAHLDDLGAGAGEQVDRLLEPGQHAVLVALAAELGDHADPDAAQVGVGALADRLDERADRLVDRRGVARVVPADDLVQHRGVQHRPGDRADLVERVGQRDQPVAGHPAVGRLHPDRAGHGSRLADRAAGVGAEGERRLERGHGGGGAAAGAARDPVEVPGVVRGAVRRVLGRASPSRTRPCWSCPGSAGRPRAAWSPPWRRTAAPSPRGSASRRWSAGHGWPGRP